MAEATAAVEQPAKKAKKDFSLNFDFCSADVLDPRLSWLNPPASFSLDKGVGLRVTPKPKGDFWRKTFRTPPADRASGHALLYSLPGHTAEEGVVRCVSKTTFTLRDRVQYDQAGLMVFIDEQHWLKAGIEVEGGVANMSCVVTNGESDWSYKTWPTTEDITLRLEMKWYSGFVECLVQHGPEGGGGSGWSFMREAPLALPTEGSIRVGVMCCAPKKASEEEEGMEAIFKHLSIQGEY